MTLFEQFQDTKNKIMQNPRLLITTILVVLLVWMILLIELIDLSDDLEREYTATQKQLTQSEELAREDFWEERKKQSNELLTRLESRLWPIQNEGLARATLQKDITGLAERAGLERLRIQIEKPVAQKGNKAFKRYKASLTSWFKPESLDIFLTEIAKDEREIIFDNFELRFKPFPYFKANLAVIMPVLNATKKKKKKRKDGGRL